MEAAARFFLHAPVRTTALRVALVFSVVLLASLFGILTRPAGFLAAFWPANAILLAMMIRNPALSSPAGWAAALTGYLAADFMTGGGLLVTFWLTVANLAGAATGYALFMKLAESDRRLNRPFSIVCMFIICAMAAAVAAAIGSRAANLVFGRDVFTGFAFWFTTELVNSIIVLPVILTAPRWKKYTFTALRKAVLSADWMPVVTLAVSIVFSVVLSGPGAFAYPLPALLWCALSYNLFATAILTLCFGVAQLAAVALGLIPIYTAGDAMMDTVSIRLAIALISLGPLAVASINCARNELLRRLQHAADHDSLTGTLARAAFMQRGARVLERAGHPLAALMIDLDHFKTVNDRYGHAVGDLVLTRSTRVIASKLRAGDVLGRLGGEEFAVLLKGASREDASIIAEGIRQAVADLDIETPAGHTLRVTVSIGVAPAEGLAGKYLHALLLDADKALYQAKSAGRNRVATIARSTPHQGKRTAA